jgi:hypothetical protein
MVACIWFRGLAIVLAAVACIVIIALVVWSALPGLG